MIILLNFATIEPNLFVSVKISVEILMVMKLLLGYFQGRFHFLDRIFKCKENFLKILKKFLNDIGNEENNSARCT